MEQGDAVEVEKVWAASPRGPLKSWCKGYEFVRAEGDVAIVKHTSGLYEGIEVREPATAVRPVQS